MYVKVYIHTDTIYNVYVHVSLHSLVFVFVMSYAVLGKSSEERPVFVDSFR